jgi:hypothetical protein
VCKLLISGPDRISVRHTHGGRGPSDTQILRPQHSPVHPRLKDFRQLGCSVRKVPVLDVGQRTFGGHGLVDSSGNADVKEATPLLDIYLDAGVRLFDTSCA